MATTNPNLQNLSVSWGVPDAPAIIADLIKRSGILQTGLVRPANYGFKHKYKWFNELPAATFRNIGGGVVPISISKDQAAIDLWNLVTLPQPDYKDIEEHPGGKAGWIAENFPAIVEGFGQTLANQIIYGTTSFGSENGFLGFHQYAKANSKVVAQAAGSSGSRTTIFAVRWNDADGASIRVGNRAGGIIGTRDLTPIDPTTVVLNTTTNAQQIVYSWIVDMFGALVIPSATSVAAITQVDATHPPTAKQMNDLLDAVETGSGTTYIYCNNLGRNQIATLKDSKVHLFNETVDYNMYLASWRGIPIIIDNNILSTETTALD